LLLRAAVVVALVLVSGCASLPTGYERSESHALQDTGSTRLGQARQELLKAHPGETGCRPLSDGVDALVARIVLAEVADRSLDVQYYIWRNDLTGRHMTSALVRAADRGVRVRLLLDDLGTNADDDSLLALDAHPHIEVRLFNPVASRSLKGLGALADFSRVNRRMHNKTFTADNQRAILGGRNIGDEYFAAGGDLAFSDLDVLMLGPTVAEVSASFDRYWNAPLSIPVAALVGRRADLAGAEERRRQLEALIETERDSPYVADARARIDQALAPDDSGLFWGQAHLLYDDPDKVNRAPEDTEGHLLPQFEALELQPRKHLLIVSPYFVPGDAGVAWLRGLVGQGVQVIILTNSLAASDVSAVHAGYKRYREALVEAGVRLYELRPDAVAGGLRKGFKGGLSGSRASLHAKTFIFDRRAVFIGSLNLDPRSVELNTEIGVVCQSVPLAEAMQDAIERHIDQDAWRIELAVDAHGSSHLVWVETGPDGVRRLKEEPQVSAWRKFGVWFLGLLPIESQL